jgi:hypothetical protein
MTMQHHQQLQLATAASSAVQVGDVLDHGAVADPHSQHRSLVVVVAGFRSSRRPPFAAVAQRTQSLVEDYQAPPGQVPSPRERR